MPRPAELPPASDFAAPSDAAKGASPCPLPLQGLTVLAVEDSRFASDALRLMCQRSGARLRRAETLAIAYAHLRLYRPDVVIVDLGLPDGRGEDLIRALCKTPGLVTLATSGDSLGRDAARAAGAQGFLEKPFPGLSGFQAEVLRNLDDKRASPAFPAPSDLAADPLALTDDLRLALSALEADPDPDKRAYIAGFLGGLARQSQDATMSAAARNLRNPTVPTYAIAALLRDRIAQGATITG